MPRDDAEQVHAETAEQWREWLAGNCLRTEGVWLVGWKRGTGRPAVPYEAAVEEALCVGWIDSTQRTLDDERSALWFAPRRKGSGWSRSNKERLDRLEREGRMQPSGRAVVEAAKADGSWTLLDDVEALVVPPDLAEALERVPGARERWDGLSRSVRREALQGLVTAKRPETRARRVEEAVRLATPTD